MNQDTILFLVSGLSPAIMTETVWALASEAAAIVPSVVHIITTTKGEQDIQSRLLTPLEGWHGKTVWDTLREDVAKMCSISDMSHLLQMTIRCIELPDESGLMKKASDVRNAKDSLSTAEFIFNELSQHSYSVDKHVIASIAGGRKTMGALLYASMALVGKHSDRCTHVLVNEPYDTCKDFFYNKQPVQKIQAGYGDKAREIIASQAVIELADIPFVALTEVFSQRGEKLRSFSGLMAHYATVEKGNYTPKLAFDIAARTITVDGKVLALRSHAEVIYYLYLRSINGHALMLDQQEAATATNAWFQAEKKKGTFTCKKEKIEKENITRALSALRMLLRENQLHAAIPFLTPDNQKDKRIGFRMMKS